MKIKLFFTTCLLLFSLNTSAIIVPYPAHQAQHNQQVTKERNESNSNYEKQNSNNYIGEYLNDSTILIYENKELVSVDEYNKRLEKWQNTKLFIAVSFLTIISLIIFIGIKLNN